MKSSVSYAVMSSICALIVGLLLILWPDVAVNYLVITIGVLFLLPGIYGLFSYFAQAKKRERANLHVSFPVIALGSTLLGLWLVIMPEFFVSILMYVLGVLLVLGGLNQILNFVSVRKYMPVPLRVYIVPTLVLIAGIVVLMNPFQAATVPFIVLGVSSMVYALSDLFRLIRYRRKYAQDITDVTPL